MTDSVLERAREIQEATVESFEQQICDRLSGPQEERLYQLQIQRAGLTAMQRHDVGARLKLTKDQLQQISEMPAPIFSPSFSQGTRRNAYDKLSGLLTVSQQREWNRVKGADFAFDAIEAEAILVY